MPKKQSEIFETIEPEEQEEEQEQEPPKKTTIKQKKEVSAERLEQLKEQLARGRAIRLAKKELIQNEKKSKVTNTNNEIAKAETKAEPKAQPKAEPKSEPKSEPKQVIDKRPVADQIWGEEIAELKNEIKSLKSRLDKPIEVKPIQKIILPVSKKDNVVISKNVEMPKKVAQSPKPTPSAPISIPKPKPNIYNAFKLAVW
jgi:hypothetical protein